jgi:hypothetical protein
MFITGKNSIVGKLAIEVRDPFLRAPRSIGIKSGDVIEVDDSLRFAPEITQAVSAGLIDISLEDDDDAAQLDLGHLKNIGEVVNALGDISGATDIDLSKGNVVTAAAINNVDFTFSNAPAGVCATFMLILAAGGSYTVTWPSPNVKWSAATPPTLTAGTDILVFSTVDGGTTWYGVMSGSNFSSDIDGRN